MLEQILKVSKNFYAISSIVFLLIMLFFAETDIFLHFRLIGEKHDLKNQKAYYQEKISKIEEERKLLLENDFKMEKYARETYLMKKPSEDLYIVVDKTED